MSTFRALQHNTRTKWKTNNMCDDYFFLMLCTVQDKKSVVLKSDAFTQLQCASGTTEMIYQVPVRRSESLVTVTDWREK